MIKIYNENIKDAIKHLLKTNILKNGKNFLVNNKGKDTIVSKKKEFKNLLLTLMNLLRFLLRRNKKKLERKTNINNNVVRYNYLKNIINKKDKEK